MDEAQDLQHQQNETCVAAAKPQNGSKKRGKLRTPVIIPELEFTNGEKSLDAYVAEHDIRAVLNRTRYAVAVRP